jgi:hypothetical protein
LHAQILEGRTREEGVVLSRGAVCNPVVVRPACEISFHDPNDGQEGRAGSSRPRHGSRY